jgi:hypothetical protein
MDDEHCWKCKRSTFKTTHGTDQSVKIHCYCPDRITCPWGIDDRLDFEKWLDKLRNSGKGNA